MAAGFPTVLAPTDDPTGLVSRAVKVIIDADFKNDVQKFTQLHTPAQAGTINDGTVSHTDRSGPGSLLMRIPNKAGAKVMGIGRADYVDHGFYLAESWVARDAINMDETRPRGANFGIDLGGLATDLVNNRAFYELAWENWNEASSTQTKKLRLLMGLGIYVEADMRDLPGSPTWNFTTNENKVLPHYLAMLIDSKTQEYVGIRVDNQLFGFIGRGSDPAQAAALRALGKKSYETLAPYAGGINHCLEIVGRSAAGATAAALRQTKARLSYLGTNLG